jgi:hypothetical protein
VQEEAPTEGAEKQELRAALAREQKKKGKREMDEEMPASPKPEIHESTF